MLTNRAALWLMGLTIAVAVLVGCVPHSLPGPVATEQSTVTVVLTSTATPTVAPTPTPVPTVEVPTATPIENQFPIDMAKRRCHD